MKHLLIIACIVLSFSSSACGQADGCRGALDALNRVKEEITPQLSASTEFGRRRLEIMESTLERGTHLCRDFGELWFYRMVVSARLGVEKDRAYAASRLDELRYVGQFDPFTSPQSAAQAPIGRQVAGSRIKQKWALVVGIDTFQDKRIPGLRFAVKDSKDFTDFLKDPDGGRFDPSHIVHLENDEATLQGIRKGLGRLRVKAQPDDLVVVYLSSHGSPRDIDPNGVSYVVTHDTNLDDSETLYSTSLQMIDLVQEINREIRAQHVVLILDTCFSGDALTSLEGVAGSSGSRGLEIVFPSDPPPDAPASSSFSQAFQNLKIGYGRAVITASRANEASWESSELKNGYFTHFLIDIMRKSHGNESIDQVFPQVRTTVSSRVKNDHDAQQNPSFEFSEGADSIVIGVPESK
jgi:uncharacterized caspase-like protein